MFATALHSQKRHRLTASYGFYRLAASSSNSVEFIKLQQVCENQTCCKSIFADLLRVVETTCIKLVDKKFWQSTRIKPVDNLQQTCYHQVGESDANASWYRLDDSKVQTCWNFRVFGCVTATISCTLKPITSTIRESIKYNLLYASACITIRNVAPARKSDYDRLVWTTFDQSTIGMRRSLIKRLFNWERASKEVLPGHYNMQLCAKSIFWCIPNLWSYSWINLVKDLLKLPNLVALCTKLHIVQHVLSVYI